MTHRPTLLRKVALLAGLLLITACEEKVPATVPPPPPPRGLPCSTQADCDPWEDCRESKCAPLGCQRSSECPSGQSCTDGACARARADFCIQTGVGECSPDLIIDFGAGDVFLAQVVEVSLRITNTGNAPLTVEAIQLADTPPHNDFQLSLSGTATGGANGPWTVTTLQDLVATVRYQPSDATPDTAQLFIATNDPEQIMVRIPVVSSIKGSVQVSPQPPALDFGYVPTGDAETLELAIVNDGTLTSVLEVREILSGYTSFHVAPRAALPHYLAVGQQLILDVTYHPVADELVESSLNVRTNDPDEPDKIVPALGFSSAKLLYVATTPPAKATQDRLYSYDALLVDPTSEGPWTWSLQTAPGNMAVEGDGATGKVRWTPTSAQLGNHTVVLKVENARGGARTQSWTIAVAGQYTLTSVTPMVASACGGAEVTLTGDNLLLASKVKFVLSAYSVEVPVTRVSSGAAVATVPPLDQSGTTSAAGWYTVEIVNVDDTTNKASLPGALLILPDVTSVSPSEAEQQEDVTLTGCGLVGATVELPTVPHGGHQAAALRSTAGTQVVFYAFSDGNPAWASGVITARVGPVQAAPWPLTIAPFGVIGGMPVLSVARATPIAGSSPPKARITGSGFSPTKENNFVRFWTSPSGQAAGTVTKASATSLDVLVPAGAITGPVEVEADGKTERSPRAYAIAGAQEARSLLAASHRWVVPMNQEKIALFGSGLGTDRSALSVKVRGSDHAQTDAEVLWAAGTVMVVRLPIVPSGPVMIEAKVGGDLLGALPLLALPQTGYLGFGAGSPPPQDGDADTASYYGRAQGPQPGVVKVGGALAFVDGTLIRIYNQAGPQTATFYGMSVAKGAVRTLNVTSASPLGGTIYSLAVDPDSSDLMVGYVYAVGRVNFATGQQTRLLGDLQGSNSGPIADANVNRVNNLEAVAGGLLYVEDWDKTHYVRLANFGSTPVTRHGVTIQAGYIQPIGGPNVAGNGMAVSPVTGDLYYATGGGHVYRRPADSSNTELVIAAEHIAAPPRGEGVPASQAKLGGYASGLAFAPSGTLYVGTTRGVIRRLKHVSGAVTSSSLVDTFVGNPLQFGFKDGSALVAELAPKVSPALDARNLLLVLGGCRMRSVTAHEDPTDRTVETVLGTGCYRPPKASQNPFRTGFGTLAPSPDGMTLYAYEPGNGVIWKVDTETGDAQVLVGLDLDPNYNASLALQGSKLYAFQGLTARVLEIDLDQEPPAVRVVAGSGDFGDTGDGGSATLATFPTTEANDRMWRRLSPAAGGLVALTQGVYKFIAGQWKLIARVRAFNPAEAAVTAYGVTIDPGQIKTIAGGGANVTEGGDALSERLERVGALTLDPKTEDILMTTGYDGRVLRLAKLDGKLTTVVGRPRGEQPAVAFGQPRTGQRAGDGGLPVWSLAIDGGGNLLLVLAENHHRRAAYVMAGPDGVLTPDSPVVQLPYYVNDMAYGGSRYFYNADGRVYRSRDAPTGD